MVSLAQGAKQLYKDVLMVTGNEIMTKWLEAQKLMRDRVDWSHMMTTQGFWTEIAGVFFLSPRQTGKTTAIRDFIGQLKKKQPESRVVTVSCFNVARELLQGPADIDLISGEVKPWLQNEMNTRTDHLVVDEFMYLDTDVKSALLDKDWQSVTMVGSMR